VHRSSRASEQINQVTAPSNALIKLAGFVGPHPAVFLVDSGATGNFVSAAFAQARALPLTEEKYPETVTLADGTQQSSGGIVRSAAVRIDSYSVRLDLTVTALSSYDVILGMPWLHQHNPTIDWRGQTISFATADAQQHVLRKTRTGAAVWVEPGHTVGARPSHGSTSFRPNELKSSSSVDCSSTPAWCTPNNSWVAPQRCRRRRARASPRSRPPTRRAPLRLAISFAITSSATNSATVALHRPRPGLRMARV